MQPKKFLTHLTTYALKTTIKRVIQKTRETTKIADRLRKSRKLHNKIIHEQLQMNVIKKHLKKGIYLQKKDRKSLMI